MDFTVLLDAPDTPVKQIQIAQLGDFSDPRYGDFSITPDDVETWKRNLSLLPGGQGLIDRDHRADRAPRSTEADGWITGNLDIEGKRVMADVEFTPAGEQAIREKRYLFLSPSYGPFKSEDGTVHENVLSGASLTNKPFLSRMPMINLASADAMTVALDQDPAQALYKRALDGELGDVTRAMVLLDVPQAERDQAVKDGHALPDGSYPIRNAHELHSAAVLAASGHGDVKAAKALIRRRAKDLGVSLSHLPGFAGAGSDSQRTMDKELLKLLGLPEDTEDEKTILDAATALKAKADEKPEPTEPAKTLDQLATENGKVLLDQSRLTQLISDSQAGAEASRQLAAARFETAFTEAIRSGKAVPAEHDTFHKFYTLDADTTLAQLKDRPQILPEKPSGWDNDSYAPGAGSEPTAQQLLDQGVHPDDHLLDQQIRTHLRANGLPQTKYIEVAEGIMRGDIVPEKATA